MRKISIIILSIICIMLTFTACKKNTKSTEPEINTKVVETAPYKAVRTIYGPKGANRRFYWDIVNADGNIDSFEVRTNEKTVGLALNNVALAKITDGEKGEETEIVISGYECEEGMKWAFYIDGELAKESPLKTEIKNGTVYTFRQIPQ